MDAISIAARAIKTGENSLVIAGGVESMSRAPFVMAKGDSAFSRSMKLEDTTIGWRLVNPLMKSPVWRGFHAGDRLRTSPKSSASRARTRTRSPIAVSSALRPRLKQRRLAEEIVPVTIAHGKGAPDRRG